MQIRYLLTTSEGALGRVDRPAVEAHYHTIKAAFRNVEYCVTPEGLVVKIHHHPKKSLIRLAAD